MTELVTEILIYLAIAALLGFLLGYLFWGWGQNARLAAARVEGIASARTSVDGSSALSTQLQECRAESERLEREVATLRHRLEAQQAARTRPLERVEDATLESSVQARMPEPDTDFITDDVPEPMVSVREGPSRSIFAAREPDPVQHPEPSAPAPASLLMERPDMVDDLKRIKGVGPKMERILNDKGVYLFHQLANFTSNDVAWVNTAIDAFPGRVERDEWVRQAQELYLGKYGRRHDDV